MTSTSASTLSSEAMHSTAKKTVPNSLLLGSVKEDIQAGKKAVIRLKGYSMRPFVENGRDKALLAPISPDQLRKGDAVLAEIQPGHYVLHRIINICGEQVTLMGDGNIAGTEQCHAENVVAIVEAFYRKERSTPDSTQGMKWRIYSAIWPHLLPIRRYLLFVYRILHKVGL